MVTCLYSIYVLEYLSTVHTVQNTHTQRLVLSLATSMNYEFCGLRHVEPAQSALESLYNILHCIKHTDRCLPLQHTIVKRNVCGAAGDYSAHAIARQ